MIKEPDNLTVSELREQLGSKDVVILLGRPEEDYGVVIAQGRGLGFIIQAAQQHHTLVSEYAKEIVDKMVGKDPEMAMTLQELKAEIPGDGISLITRNDGGPDDRFLSLIATGEAAEALFHMLDAHGMLDPQHTNPGNSHSAEA